MSDLLYTEVKAHTFETAGVAILLASQSVEFGVSAGVLADFGAKANPLLNFAVGPSRSARCFATVR